MVFVCNLRNIYSLANVVILFAIKTCQPCHYIKPIVRAYTRECHENKICVSGLPMLLTGFFAAKISAKLSHIWTQIKLFCLETLIKIVLEVQQGVQPHYCDVFS